MKIASTYQPHPSSSKQTPQTPQNKSPRFQKSPGNKCNCLLKLNSFGEQIVKINEKIRLLFTLIQLPANVVEEQKKEGIDQLKQPFCKTIRPPDSSFEESFLLDGIECEEFVLGIENNTLRKGANFKTLQIGSKVAQIYEKMKVLQEKSEYLSKFKNHFSMLTKIVQQIQLKLQKQQAQAIHSSNQQYHHVTTSCSIEQPQKKTMQTIQKSKKSKKEMENHRDLVISQISELRARQSYPLKSGGKVQQKMHQC